MEGNDSPAARPRSSTASPKPSILAKFNSASAATPADVTKWLCTTGVDQYVAQLTINRTSCPMCWWAQHKPSYPILSSVAQTMLCMPATSVSSERVFSKAGDVSRAKKYAGAVKSRHLSFFWSTICDCCIAVTTLGFWHSCYVTKYVELCTLSLSDLDFSVAT